jgi:hypothetical protein
LQDFCSPAQDAPGATPCSNGIVKPTPQANQNLRRASGEDIFISLFDEM